MMRNVKIVHQRVRRDRYTGGGWHKYTSEESELVISLSTVKTHVQRIISNLKISHHTQAAVKAVELGLYGE